MEHEAASNVLGVRTGHAPDRVVIELAGVLDLNAADRLVAWSTMPWWAGLLTSSSTPAIQPEYVVGVVEGTGRLVPTQHAPEAVQEQQRDDDTDLLDQLGPVSASSPAGDRRTAG
jgi:hypothetical protein